MALKEDVPALLKAIQAQANTLGHNAELFDIYEGNLLPYVLQDLKRQLSPQSYDQIQHRVAPVNVLKRLIDKLSKIYCETPARTLAIDDAKDQDLFGIYLKMMDFNTKMQLGNEFFNLFKNVAFEPYVSNRKPALRVIPSDRFVVWSNDSVDPTRATHFAKLMGKQTVTDQYGKKKVVDIVYLYTAEEFLVITTKGDILAAEMAKMANPNGINPIGKLPIVYSSRSMVNLIPAIDTDTLRMTKIFPVLLSDLNFSVMYQAFSIIYGIDVDDQDIAMSPNAFWRFKSDPSTQSKPEIGVIKPQVDIQQVVGFIMAQLAFWLQSRNIRPGSTGTVTPENFSSGVSKIVDEMDTYEERQKQVPFFRQTEHELWELLMHGYHPYWVREKLIDETRLFAPSQSVEAEFAEQKPMVRRMDTLGEIEKELTLRLTTRKNSIQRLNPDMSEQQVDEFIAEIDQEGTVDLPGDSSAITQADHTHSTPYGATGPMVLDEEGHYHASPKGETSTEANTAGHTHSLPNGSETGAPIPIRVEEEL